VRRHENEPFVVSREVRAVIVPAGQEVKLKPGQAGYITQEIPINIVDLGLVYDCSVTQNEDGTRTVDVTITLTAPGCGMGDILVDDVRDKIGRIPTVREARVTLTFDPPWNQSMMSEAARLQTGMF